MKILFYRYGSICEPDIIDGFCELGNEVVTITEEIYNKKLLPSEGVALLNEALQKASYDFVFSINFYPYLRSLQHFSDSLSLLDRGQSGHGTLFRFHPQSVESDFSL